MAPEQFRRQATDARSDQFSFCVALYEALYGTPPFGADRVDALMPKVLAGGVDPAPPTSSVPAWLRRVLLRGLSVDPGARWPTMAALLAALRRDPARARRRAALSAGAVMLVAVAGLVVARGGQEPAQLCLAGPARHPDIAGSLNNESNTLARMGRMSEALRLSERAYDLYVQAYGPASIEASFTLSNRGEHLLAVGRAAEALDDGRRSLAGWQAQIGEHVFLGYPLTVIGRALLDLERPKEAVAPLERALRLREAGEQDALVVADTRFALARALWDGDGNRARARALAEKARAGYGTAERAGENGVVDAWLAAHPAPGTRAR